MLGQGIPVTDFSERYKAFYSSFPDTESRLVAARTIAFGRSDEPLPSQVELSHNVIAAYWGDDEDQTHEVAQALWTLKKLVDTHAGQAIVLLDQDGEATLENGLRRRDEPNPDPDRAVLSKPVKAQFGAIMRHNGIYTSSGALNLQFSGSKANSPPYMNIPRPRLALSVGVQVVNRQLLTIDTDGSIEASGMLSPDETVANIQIFIGAVSLNGNRETYQRLRLFEQIGEPIFGNEAAIALVGSFALLRNRHGSNQAEALQLSNTEPLPDLATIF